MYRVTFANGIIFRLIGYEDIREMVVDCVDLYCPQCGPITRIEKVNKFEEL